MFCSHTWQSAQWRAFCTKITEVNLSAFVYWLFHEDFSTRRREIFTKQSVNKCRQINFCNLCVIVELCWYATCDLYLLSCAVKNILDSVIPFYAPTGCNSSCNFYMPCILPFLQYIISLFVSALTTMCSIIGRKYCYYTHLTVLLPR